MSRRLPLISSVPYRFRHRDAAPFPRPHPETGSVFGGQATLPSGDVSEVKVSLGLCAAITRKTSVQESLNQRPVHSVPTSGRAPCRAPRRLPQPCRASRRCDAALARLAWHAECSGLGSSLADRRRATFWAGGPPHPFHPQPTSRPTPLAADGRSCAGAANRHATIHCR